MKGSYNEVPPFGNVPKESDYFWVILWQLSFRRSCKKRVRSPPGKQLFPSFPPLLFTDVVFVVLARVWHKAR